MAVLRWVRRSAIRPARLKMNSHLQRTVLCLASGITVLATSAAVWAQGSLNPPITQPTSVQQPVQSVQQSVQQHPLVPALEMAYKTRDVINSTLRDYSAVVVKQERIGGTWGEKEYAFIKVRQQPFSVYMYFIGPENLKGQECMYIEGQNNNNMFAHAPPGTLRARIGTVSISPTSAIAMRDQRYPITELGVANLTKRLIEVGEHDKEYGECDVKFFQGAKVDGRDCTVIQVTHPVPRRTFIFHQAKIYLDTQLGVPIRYEAYDWPDHPGGEPIELEEYTYRNLKINPGFTDADFDVHNASYGFKMK